MITEIEELRRTVLAHEPLVIMGVEYRPTVTVEQIYDAVLEIDHAIAAQLEENVLFTDEDAKGRHDYSVALHAILTR